MTDSDPNKPQCTCHHAQERDTIELTAEYTCNGCGRAFGLVDAVPIAELEQLADGLRADIETTREANKKWTGEAKYIHYRDGRVTALEGVVADLNDIIESYE